MMLRIWFRKRNIFNDAFDKEADLELLTGVKS
jgi:hypothetical protein